MTPLLLATLIACNCGRGYGRTPWDVAQDNARRAALIFEGQATRAELQWPFLTTPDGSIEKPFTGHLEEIAGHDPRMAITFRVSRVYKGAVAAETQIFTGFGGGDCGSQFQPGITYLVFVTRSSSHEMIVTMCSPTQWIGSNRIEPDLRYLRKERPTASDMASIRAGTSKDREERERLSWRELDRRYSVALGTICGSISPARSGLVRFLASIGYSPVETPLTEVGADGKFCSPRLGPGAYRVVFIGAGESAYYPGVPSRAQAKTVSVIAGQTLANITFPVPHQETHVIRGFLSAGSFKGIAHLGLFSLDGEPRELGSETVVEFPGSFPFSGTRYFQMDNVRPGRYLVTSWDGNLRKLTIEVGTHDKFIHLQMEPWR